nr:hypothetical protein [Erythrotrichia longistipitata]
MLYSFFNFSTSHDLHSILTRLFSSFQISSDSRNTFANKYLRKYRSYYRKKMHPYRVGEAYYTNDICINSLAISYAHLLYLVVVQNDFYFFLESLYSFSPPYFKLLPNEFE